MNYLKEILWRDPSMALPAVAAFIKMHMSNVVVAKQPTKIIEHPATINYRNKVASQLILKPYTSRELAELYGVDKTTLKKWIKPLKVNLRATTCCS